MGKGSYAIRDNTTSIFQEVKGSIGVVVSVNGREDYMIPVPKKAIGIELLDIITGRLQLKENARYFGLHFPTSAHDTSIAREPKVWLKSDVSVLKQAKKLKKGVNPINLVFAVKYWCARPWLLPQGDAKAQFFLQLRKDVSSGDLLSSPEDMLLLATYVVQLDIGDFDPVLHNSQGYLLELPQLMGPDDNLTVDQEDAIRSGHISLRGSASEESMGRYLLLASQQMLYGCEYFKAVTDHADYPGPVVLGIGFRGILVLREGRMHGLFAWTELARISFRKTYLLLWRKGVAEEAAFQCTTVKVCRGVWEHTVARYRFYSSDGISIRSSQNFASTDLPFVRTPNAPGRGSVLLFSPWMKKQASTASLSPGTDKDSTPGDIDSASLERKAKVTVPVQPPPASSTTDTDSSRMSRTMPSSLEDVSHLSTSQSLSQKMLSSTTAELTLNTTHNNVSLRRQCTEAIRLTRTDGERLGVLFAGVPLNPDELENNTTLMRGVRVTRVDPGFAAGKDGRLQVNDVVYQADSYNMTGGAFMADIMNSVTKASVFMVTRSGHEVLLPLDDEGGLGLEIVDGGDLPISIRSVRENSPAAGIPLLQPGYELVAINYVQLKGLTLTEVYAMIKDAGKSAEPPASGSPYRPSQVSIRLLVNPCYKRDMLIEASESKGVKKNPSSKKEQQPAWSTMEVNLKNGDGYTTTPSQTFNNSTAPETTVDVVNPFVAKGSLARGAGGGSVKNTTSYNMFKALEVEQQTKSVAGTSNVENYVASWSSFQGEEVPSTSTPGGGTAVEAEALDVVDFVRKPRGSMWHFDPHATADSPTPEKLPGVMEKGDFKALSPFKDGYTIADVVVAMKSENSTRNRYRDILPYDSSRVMLASEPGGNNYINASNVRYALPTEELRYIACQGPKEGTVGHFWNMVLQEGSRIVLMVTTLREDGKVKCQKYWPDLGETMEADDIRLSLVNEINKGGFFVREITVQRAQTTRTVIQMQFASWPDHGVPADPQIFINFFNEVQNQQLAIKTTSPMVIHCSAGVGRTGVFILTEVCLALFKAGVHVDLAKVLHHLRQQRMSLVQTEGQFNFCYSILERLISA